MIKIGNATLIHGRCEDWLPLIGPVDALVMDPPYLIRTSGGGKWHKERNLMERIESLDIAKGFDINTINPALYKSIVTFCHNDQLCTITPWMAQHYRRHAVCFWEKKNPMPMANRNYQANLEPYVHAWQQGAHPTGELEDLKRTVQSAVGKSKYDHPTVKPDVVMDKIIKNVNAETIIDPFMGTGSTGIAALKQGKKFIGIEKDARVFAIACSRVMEFYACTGGVSVAS